MEDHLCQQIATNTEEATIDKPEVVHLKQIGNLEKKNGKEENPKLYFRSQSVFSENQDNNSIYNKQFILNS
jgi:hypothetical protein